MAIDKTSYSELSMVSYIIKNNIHDKNYPLLLSNIVDEVLKEAILNDKNIKQNIATILSEFPTLCDPLKEYIQKEHPEYNEYVQKLLILI